MEEEFIAIESTPKDVQSAINMLASIAQKQNDTKLLIKVGAIQGAYDVYKRTSDASILEHMIIDLIMLFKTSANTQPTFSSGFYTKNNDLIYFSCDSKEEAIHPEELIYRFLETAQTKKVLSENTITSYTSSLNKLFRDMFGDNIKPIQISRIKDLAMNIQKIINSSESELHDGKPKYNHNILSAARGFVKYLLDNYCK